MRMADLQCVKVLRRCSPPSRDRQSTLERAAAVRPGASKVAYTGCPGKIELCMLPDGSVVAGATVIPCDGSHSSKSVSALQLNAADNYTDAQVRSWAQERLEGTLVASIVRRITRENAQQPGYRRLLYLMSTTGALDKTSTDDNTAMVQAMVGQDCAVLTWWSVKEGTESRRSKRKRQSGRAGTPAGGMARMRDRDHVYVLTLPDHPDPVEVPRDFVERTWAEERLLASAPVSAQ
jgi:hypothetical protein